MRKIPQGLICKRSIVKHRQTGKKLEIRLLGSDNLNAENIEKLEKEISLLRHLPQKRYFTNIVDVIEKEGRLNVVTETIRMPLSEVLKRHFPVGCSLKFASTMMSDVCKIVKKMH